MIRAKIRQNLLSIGIAIVLMLSIAYGISAFYPPPNNMDFCADENLKTVLDGQTCMAQEGEWITFDNSGGTGGLCQPHRKCLEDYNDALRRYEKYVIILSLFPALIAMILGVVLLDVPSVGSGILLGGGLTMMIGLFRYWSQASGLFRFIMLGATFAALVLYGYTRLNAGNSNRPI